MDNLILQLRGMSCASCASTVEKVIQAVPGVIECQVNFGAAQATVEYNPQQTGLEQIQSAVLKAGYQASVLQEVGEEDEEKIFRQAELRELKRKICNIPQFDCSRTRYFSRSFDG